MGAFSIKEMSFDFELIGRFTLETRKLHNRIVMVLIPVTYLHFIFGGYKMEKFILGIIFYSIGTAIYLSFNYLFHKSEAGKKVVLWGLVLIAITSLIMVFLLH